MGLLLLQEAEGDPDPEQEPEDEVDEPNPLTANYFNAERRKARRHIQDSMRGIHRGG